MYVQERKRETEERGRMSERRKAGGMSTDLSQVSPSPSWHTREGGREGERRGGEKERISA